MNHSPGFCPVDWVNEIRAFLPMSCWLRVLSRSGHAQPVVLGAVEPLQCRVHQQGCSGCADRSVLLGHNGAFPWTDAAELGASAVPAACSLAAARHFYSCLPVTQPISSCDGIRMAFDHSTAHNCLAFITPV